MGEWLVPDDVPGVDDAESLIEQIEALLTLHFSCAIAAAIADAEKAKLLKVILKRVVSRWDEFGPVPIASQGAGPFQVRYATSAGGFALASSDAADLRALCGQPVGAMPRGRFPEAESFDRVFARRPGWPR